MSAPSSTEARLRRIAADSLGVEARRLHAEAVLFVQTGASGFDGRLELVAVVESHFDIAIPAEEIEQIRTFGDLLAAVEQKIAGRAA